MIFAQQIGAVPADQGIEAKARKLCRDYDLPESTCAGLIQCAKEREWKQCATELIAIAAMGGCAYAGVPAYLVPACGTIARWLVNSISLTGRIGGCDLIPVRKITLPENPREALDELNLGEVLMQHWARPDEYWVYMMAVNCTEDMRRLAGTHLLRGVLGPVIVDTAEGRRRVKLTDKYTDGTPVPSLERWYAGAQRADGTFEPRGTFYDRTIAAKDWNENEWIVEPGKARFIPVEETEWKKPFIFQPLTVQYVPLPTLPPPPPTGYPPGSIAIFDGGPQKYRILAPT